jgi:hypothetical protein
MGHIERRVWSGKPSYRARYRDPTGRERSRSFSRKVDAERWLAEVEHTKSRGMWTDPRLGRVLFADWLAAWWSTTTNLRPTTQARDETLLRLHALPRFGNLPLVAIRQLEVRAWVTELSASGLAPATVVKTYQLLGKVMAAAVDAGYLAQTPCRNVPLPKIEQEEMRFLGPTEIVHLAEVIHPRYRALVYVGAYGGLRIGELAAPPEACRSHARSGHRGGDRHGGQGKTVLRAAQDASQPANGRAAALRRPRAPSPSHSTGEPKQPGLHRTHRRTAAGPQLSGALLGPGHQGSWP